jgi:hypothetical protein
MPDPYPEAVQLLEHYKAELGVAEPDTYVAAVTAALAAHENERAADARAAATMAVDAAKSLITIGIAFFAALGAFALNYRSTHANLTISHSVLLLALAAFLTVASMWSGFIAIGTAYKRGQRPADTQGPPWSTRPLSGFLGAQSLLGLLALLCFGGAVLSWDAGSSGDLDDVKKRIDQQADEIARLDQRVVGMAQATATVGALDTRLHDVETAVAELKTRLPTPAPPSASPAGPPAANAPKPPHASRQESELGSADWAIIQAVLNKQGYDPGPADGRPGAKTRRAIRAYQAANHAPADGRLTQEQIEALSAGAF